MRVLALDLSKTSTGWALWAPGDTPASGTWSLGSPLTSMGKVFGRLHQNMMALHQLGAIDAIFYEDTLNIHPGAVATNKESVLLSAGLCTHAESFGDAVGVRIIRAVNQTTWRREFIGRMKRGTKSVDLKAYSMERCRQLGFRPAKHDEAEALGILTYACVALDLKAPWLANEILRPPLGFSKS